MKRTQKKSWYYSIIFIEVIIIGTLSYSIYLFIKNDTRSVPEIIPTPETEKNDLDDIKIVNPATTTEAEFTNKEPPVVLTSNLLKYIEVTDGCGPHFEGECLNVRSGPDTTYPSVAKLRNGMILKIDEQVETNGQIWYKVIFDEWLRYPERLKSDWYVDARYVQIVNNDGPKTIPEADQATNTKEIIVDRSEQKLYAYENGELFLETSISTGLEITPTPRGQFTVFRKTPTRYMQGPLPNLIDQQYYDLPGVPWNMYFTDGGAVIHGAYWHNSFGTRYSHGCVNLPPNIARELYEWTPIGTKVTVKD